MKKLILLILIPSVSSVAYAGAGGSELLVEEEVTAHDPVRSWMHLLPFTYLVVVGLSMIMKDHMELNEFHMRDV